MQLGPGDKIGRRFGDYLVERLLGRGGMGSAYLARTSRGEPVVLKFLLASHDAKLRRRFQREGEALLRVRSHPNVVRALALELDGEEPFIVMEWVAGLTLSGALQRRGPLPPAEAASFACDVARGLATVHAYGLIHRDVKPDNVIVTPDGGARLVDFGVAKDQFQSSLTQPGQLIGTAPYVAPELWEGKPPTPAADLFSLGATLYHVAVGRPPFAAEELADLSEQILEGDYERPCRARPGFPAELEQVIVQALEPEPRFRYRAAEELIDDLQRAGRGVPVSAPGLLRPDGSRVTLLGTRRLTIGSGPRCAVRVEGPGVTGEHAELRRTAAGYTLVDLSGGATRIDGDVVRGPTPLSDGARIEVGATALELADPRGRERPPTLVPADPWRPAPALLLDALIALGDPRAIADLLSRWAPEEDVERRVGEILRQLVGDAGADDLLRERREHVARIRAGLPQALSAAGAQLLSGAPAPEPAAWLRWWDRARARAPLQLCVAGPLLPLRLEVEGRPGAAGLVLDGSGGVLIGRDPRCHVRIDDPTVSKLHASLVPHLRRWLLRDEGSSYGVKVDEQRVEVALVDAGAVVRVGDVRLKLSPAAAQAEPLRLDPLTLRLLQQRGHPVAATSLVAALAAERDTAWVERTALALFAQDPARARACAEHMRRALRAPADLARAWLPRLLGAVAAEPGGWQELLARRAATLGPQAVAEDQEG